MNQSLRSGLLGYQYYEVALRPAWIAPQRAEIHPLILSIRLPVRAAMNCRNMRSIRAACLPSRTASARWRASVWNSTISSGLRDLRDLCLDALKTETVMVKREDEQAFAEMNAAYLKFVEDAVRLVYEQLDDDPRIRDFKVIASHQESLHSHDAVSVIVKGIEGGFRPKIEPSTLTSLIHKI